MLHAVLLVQEFPACGEQQIDYYRDIRTIRNNIMKKFQGLNSPWILDCLVVPVALVLHCCQSPLAVRQGLLAPSLLGYQAVQSGLVLPECLEVPERQS